MPTKIGSLVVDSRKRQVVLRGRDLDLAGLEFQFVEVLAILGTASGDAVPDIEFVKRLWGPPRSGERIPPQRLKQLVSRLRRRGVSVVRARGYGYRLLTA
jgi:DNA-binding response OmpR family regulator